MTVCHICVALLKFMRVKLLQQYAATNLHWQWNLASLLLSRVLLVVLLRPRFPMEQRCRLVWVAYLMLCLLALRTTSTWVYTPRRWPTEWYVSWKKVLLTIASRRFGRVRALQVLHLVQSACMISCTTMRMWSSMMLLGPMIHKWFVRTQNPLQSTVQLRWTWPDRFVPIALAQWFSRVWADSMTSCMVQHSIPKAKPSLLFLLAQERGKARLFQLWLLELAWWPLASRRSML